MASKKRKNEEERYRDVIIRWPVYAISVIITVFIIYTITMNYMGNMGWDSSILFSLVLPTIFTMLGIMTFIYLPWIWVSRKKLTQDYMDFKKTMTSILSEEKG